MAKAKKANGTAELVESVRRNVTMDSRESVRAKLRVAVKRVLRKHGYPPDKQEKATATVMEQAEGLAYDWIWPDKAPALSALAERSERVPSTASGLSRRQERAVARSALLLYACQG